MARVGAPYLPIRPAGHKPAPVPYFHELMKAQNMLPVGITALAASTGGEDESEDEINLDDIELDDYEKGVVEETREKYGDEAARNTEKSFKLTKKMMQPQVEEQEKKLEESLSEAKETVKKLIEEVKEDPRNKESFSEDMIDDAADAVVESALKKMEEGLSHKKAMAEAWQEVYETLTGGGLTRHARGGLVGINELTRGL